MAGPDVNGLRGITVVEVGSYFSSPMASYIFSQMGARVIKVEPPSGDPFRTFAHLHKGLSAAWLNVNNGKDRRLLDLKAPDDVEQMADLVASADVFIQNWRPGVAEDLGFGYDRLSESNRRLIYVSVTGYGRGGPNCDAPVFDSVIQAATGLSVLEARGDSPTVLRSFIADKVTALYAVQATLLALFERERTGSGALIELAMFDALAHFNFPDLYAERTFLEEECAPVTPPTQPAIFPTVDGHVCVVPARGKDVVALADCLGHPEWVPRLKELGRGPALMCELTRLCSSVTVARTTAQCLEIFGSVGVAATRVMGPDEHLSDAQTIHRDLYSEVTSEVGPVRRIRYPALWTDKPGVRAPATEPI